MDQDAENRKQHFEKMKGFQQRNDIKYNQFNNYQAHGNFKDAAKRDEEIMLKQMAERDARELQDMQKKRDQDIRNKNQASVALHMQMKEKETKKMLDAQNDVHYAQ